MTAYPMQSANDVCHLRTEHTSVAVDLVYDNESEVGEKFSPGRMMRQHSVVKHVWICEDYVPLVSKLLTHLCRSVTIICPSHYREVRIEVL